MSAHPLEKAALNIQVPVDDLLELRAKLEGGHIVQWQEGDKHFVCQKRGKEYVTVMAHSEQKALDDWQLLMKRGHFYDAKRKTRITIPGCR